MARNERDRQAETSPPILFPVVLVLIAGTLAILWVWASHRAVWQDRPAASVTPVHPRDAAVALEGSESSGEPAEPHGPHDQMGEANRTAAYAPPVVRPADERANGLPRASETTPAPPKTAGVDYRTGAATEQWWQGPATVSCRLFLFDQVDAAGVRRCHGPAPLGQRYVIVSTSLRWDGREGQSPVTGTETIEPPTVGLKHGQRRLDPLGRLNDRSDPLRGLSTSSLTVPPGETVGVDLVFLVPEAADTVSLVVGGRTGETLSLPPVPSVDVDSLKGRWRKSPHQLRPLRFADLLVNALADPGCDRAMILRNREGFLQLSFPATSIVSSPLNEQAADRGAMAMTLSRESDTITASLRVGEGGESFLLYLPVDHAVFLFERVAD